MTEKDYGDTLQRFSNMREYLIRNMETFNKMDHFFQSMNIKEDSEVDMSETIVDDKSSISGGSRISSQKSKNPASFLVTNFETIIENGDILDQRTEKVQIAHDFEMIGSQFLNQ